jgi:hypothetical protein
VATLRNKTTSEGVIVRWKSHPDLNSPKTYQVKKGAVSFLADLGYKVPTPGDETELPSDVCHPLRLLEDLYFMSGGSGNTSGKQIKKIDEGYSETLSEAQRKKLEKYVEGHNNSNIYSKKLDNGNSSLSSKNNDANSNRREYQSKLQEKDKIIDEVDRIWNY